MDDTPIPTLAERIRAIPVPDYMPIWTASATGYIEALRAAAALVEVEAAKTPIGSADSVASSSPPAAACTTPSLKCPNMKDREGCTSMSYEHYDCKVCGGHIALDYDEMR